MKKTLLKKISLDQSKENFSFDLLKLIFCYFVVAIHTGLDIGSQNTDYYLIQGLFRMAVPCYFFMAGYFLFSKVPYDNKIISPQKDIVISYIKRLIFMYVIWSGFYLIDQIITSIRDGITVRDIMIYVEFFIVRGDSYLHLWYLSSLFTGVALVYFCRKFFNTKAVFFVSLAFFIVGLLLLPYYFLIDDAVESSSILTALVTMFNRFIGSPRNGLFFGFFFVAFGALISRIKIIPCLWLSILGIIVSLAISFAELTLFKHTWAFDSEVYGALQLSSIPLSYFAFSLASNIKFRDIRNAKNIRKMTTLIYLIHPLIIIIYSGIHNISNFSLPFKSIFIYIVSIAVSVLWLKLEQLKRLTFLKKLH